MSCGRIAIIGGGEWGARAIARDMRIVENLIARRAKPDAAVLSAPSTRLKSLLAA